MAKKNPETLPELQEYLRSRFNFHFANQNTLEEIQMVLKWMQEDSPQVLTWDGASSFSTLFLPFHTGAPFMKKMLAQHQFPERLLRFLETATVLESTTDQFAYIDTVNQLQKKIRSLPIFRTS